MPAHPVIEEYSPDVYLDFDNNVTDQGSVGLSAATIGGGATYSLVAGGVPGGGRALYLDGTDDYVELGTVSTFNDAHQGADIFFTMIGMFKLDNPGTRSEGFWGNGHNTTEHGVGIQYFQPDDKSYISINGGASGNPRAAIEHTSGITSSDTGWIMLSLVMDNDTAYYYKNGILVSSVTDTSPVSSSDASEIMNIGCYISSTRSRFLKGYLSHWMYKTAALDAADIGYIYKSMKLKRPALFSFDLLDKANAVPTSLSGYTATVFDVNDTTMDKVSSPTISAGVITSEIQSSLADATTTHVAIIKDSDPADDHCVASGTLDWVSGQT